MLNREKHRVILNQLLIEIYRNPRLAKCLGFKGGTACMYFYGLDRFSTDLDFDLLDDSKAQDIQKILRTLLSKYGAVKEEYLRTNTIFFLLSYGASDMNTKIEISTRNYPSTYELKSWNGLSIPVMSKSSMLSNKLVAITERDANRDIYDVYFFLNQGWDYDPELIRRRKNMSMPEFFQEVLNSLEARQGANLMERLGEVLLTDKQKYFVKHNLLDELIWKIRALG